ncbi:MAG: aspartate carbamoyltransferase regulatory subunit [Salinivirgaceae bacterium]|nr:MAG: aspartate carbamoyltransferase regulatory subunit [Salinivirgaceae bacterium]
MKDKTLSVSAIKEGTVIDHIPADSLFDVLSILRLDELESQITFGTNLKSEKYGKKAIIKLEGKFFMDDEINRIALVAPEAKLNIIRDYKVDEKKVVGLPDEIIGIAKCMNPKCVTNNETVTTKFKVIDKKVVTLKCHYCEKLTDKKHLKII